MIDKEIEEFFKLHAKWNNDQLQPDTYDYRHFIQLRDQFFAEKLEQQIEYIAEARCKDEEELQILSQVQGMTMQDVMNVLDESCRIATESEKEKNLPEIQQKINDARRSLSLYSVARLFNSHSR